MKIICIEPSAGSDNGVAALHDLEGAALYLKPETALTRSDWPFFVPDWSDQIAFRPQLVVKVCRLGKSIPERFAHRYYDEVTMGVGFTARDVQQQLAQAGLPWDVATGFDGSAYYGQRWLKLSQMAPDGQKRADVQRLTYSVALNGQPMAEGQTADMRPTVDRIVAFASRYYLLKTGDLIFCGWPRTEGIVHEGDVISATLQGEEVLTCRCK